MLLYDIDIACCYLGLTRPPRLHTSPLWSVRDARRSLQTRPEPGWDALLDSRMEDDDGPRRQIYVRAKQGKPLQISLDDLLKFFEDAAVGKPTSVLNKWGEDPVDGRIYELALVTFKKNKAVQRALGLSGSYLGDREVASGTSSHPHITTPSADAHVHAYALAHILTGGHRNQQSASQAARSG